MRVSTSPHFHHRQSVHPGFFVVVVLVCLLKTQVMLRASCLMLKIKEFGCYIRRK